MAKGSKVAYIFPPQGPQHVGMGKDLAEKYSAAKEAFDQADSLMGYSLSKVMWEGPYEDLTRTDNVQPALLVHSVAAMRAVQQASNNSFPKADFTAGYSLGEYISFVAAGVLTFPDCVKVLQLRGSSMNKAAQAFPGGMLVIMGLDRKEVDDIALWSGTEVSNLNCPGQIVVSGAKFAVEKAERLATERGAKKTVRFKVSGAFHSSLMMPIIGEYVDGALKYDFKAPQFPVISNYSAKPLTTVDAIKRELVLQLRNAVNWEASINYMIDQGVTTFYEIGAGKQCSGYINNINPDVTTINIGTVEDIENFLASR